MGLKMDEVKSLSAAETDDRRKVQDKLAEIKATLDALTQSKGENKVVVQSWFETEESPKK